MTELLPRREEQDFTPAEEVVRERLLARTKVIRRQMGDVLRLWLEGLSAKAIAARLCVTRERVVFVLRVLQLSGKPPKRSLVHLFGEARGTRGASHFSSTENLRAEEPLITRRTGTRS